MFRKQPFLLIMLLLSTAVRLSAAPPKVAIVGDTSGSMAGEKLRALQEGSKLAMALLDGEVVFIQFDTDVKVHSPMSLAGAADRRSAMRMIDGLGTGGSTNYPAALAALSKLSSGTPTILVSDGENREGTDEQVLNLVRKAPGPIYTIAVDASGTAEKLLHEIAAQSGGSMVSVDDAEALTKAILAIAQRLGRYHSHSPSEKILRFRNCQDSIIAIGYDTVPSMVGSPPFREPPFEHSAKLRTEQVALTRVKLSAPTNLEIRSLHAKKPTARLARVLRNDLAQPVLHVSNVDGKVPSGGLLNVTTDFISRDGKRVAPGPSVQVEYLLKDSNNNTVARKTAEPSPDQKTLKATLPVPDQAGPLTIVQTAKDTTTGVSFFSEERRTVIAVDPVRLKAEPSQLDLATSQRTFTIELKIKPALNDQTALSAYTAELAGSHQHFQLTKSQSRGEKLAIEFRADQHGIYRGDLVVTGNSAVPVAPLKVPYRFEVQQSYLGLDLPTSYDVNLGSVFANSGKTAIASWKIPSLDTAPTPKIQVLVSDLASGLGVVALEADQSTIQPTKETPAPLKLMANVGNVPAGVHTGTVTFRSTSTPNRKWQANLKLTVNEPLTAAPLDFGKVEVGGTGKRTLLVRNAAGPIRNATLALGPFVQGDHQLAPTDIAIKVQDTIPIVPGRTETAINVALTASPLLQARGAFEASLSIIRTPNQRTEIPVRLKLISKDEGKSDLLVAPTGLRLKAQAGEVVKFSLRVKLADNGLGVMNLLVKTQLFEDADGRPQVIDSDFVFRAGSKLSAGKPVTIDGFLIAPSGKGTFQGTLSIRSGEGETKRVPVTIDVN